MPGPHGRRCAAIRPLAVGRPRSPVPALSEAQQAWVMPVGAAGGGDSGLDGASESPCGRAHYATASGTVGSLSVRPEPAAWGPGRGRHV